MNGVRINKYLSQSGYCSRRQADDLVKAQKVRIQGELAKPGDKVLPGMKVTVDGKNVSNDVSKVYIAYNKPEGIVCTSNQRIRNNIIDAVGYPEKLFTVGRLDKDSEGLIFLTNDGEMSYRIMRTASGHEKEYEVSVDRGIDEIFISSMSAGIPVLGKITKECQVTKTGPKSFRIVLTQGLNRQIRRMCEYLGYKVIHLTRIRIMNVNLSGLKSGQWRYLSPKEVSELKRMTGMKTEKENG